MSSFNGPSTSNEIGLRGEQLAVDYLMEKKYEIIKRRFRFRNGEIDIIARLGNLLVFVEVKTADVSRGPSRFGDPETWMNPKKMKFLRQSADYYYAKNNIVDSDCRFDLIAVRIYGEKSEINHIENAFWM